MRIPVTVTAAAILAFLRAMNSKPFVSFVGSAITMIAWRSFGMTDPPIQSEEDLEADIQSFILPPANRAQRRSAMKIPVVTRVSPKEEANRKARRKAANHSRARNRA